MKFCKKIDILERGKVRVRFNNSLMFEDEKPRPEKATAGNIPVAPTPVAASKSSTVNTPQEGLAQIKFREHDKNMNYIMRENLISIGKASGNEKSSLKKSSSFTTTKAVLRKITCRFASIPQRGYSTSQCLLIRG